MTSARRKVLSFHPAGRAFRALQIAIALAFLPCAFGADVYFNDFNGPPGTSYPEWSSSGYSNTANAAGTVAAGAGPQTVTNIDSPNRRQRFLGEFGGPVIVAAPPYDRQHFVRVNQTITLTLRNLNPHSLATVSFDLYILRSWDGNNPNYGPDRWSLSVGEGPVLLDTTFSNNFKTGNDLSLQNYPAADSSPQTSATAVNSLGSTFYGDSTYHLTFTFVHTGETLIVNFSSSLFEGKGTDDESWGLDNVRVSTNQDNPAVVSATSPAIGLATESLGSIYGVALAAVTETAASQPPPTRLGNVSVSILDAAGQARDAPLLYVSPSQINFEVPAGTSDGAATFTIRNETRTTLSGAVNILAVAPGLFTANGDGRGVAAATAVRISADLNLQNQVTVFQCGGTPGSCVSVPIELVVDAPVYVSLYGSGLRGAAPDTVTVRIGSAQVPVLYVGALPLYAGLDQVNISLPPALRGMGETDLVLSASGQSSNTVRINIR